MHKQTAETRNNRMEDITFHSHIVCDRCGKERPEGSNGLGWLYGRMKNDGKWDWHGYDSTAREVDICPDCFESDEESERAIHQVIQYIHFSLFRRSRILRDINSRHLSDQKSFLKDCGIVSNLLKKHRRHQNQKLYKSYYAGKSLTVSGDVYDFLISRGKPLSDDSLKNVLENSAGQVLFIDGDSRRIFVAKDREDLLALYWHARNKARMYTRKPLDFNLKDISSSDEHTANGWKAVARYARQKIKQLNLRKKPPSKIQPIVFERIPGDPFGTVLSP